MQLRFLLSLVAFALVLTAPPAFGGGTTDEDGDGFDSGEDCDDENPAVYPGAEELCNGLDDNCDGVLEPVETDLDGDGFRLCDGFECDDTRAEVHAGAPELCDGLDSDCDGEVPGDEADGDGDGWRVCAADCDDEEAAVHPGAAEICDGLDNDCSGTLLDTEIDVDGDGLAPCAGDCDDDQRAARAGALEQCDGIDNNCDGDIDEGCVPLGEVPPDSGNSGCTQRGCGWSIPPKESVLLVFLLPGAGLVRRRRGRSRT